LEAGFVLTGLIVVLFIVGSQNPYFSRFWRYWTEAKERKRSYLEYIAFQQRFVYWETAYRTFETYPALGVGLGNYVFYFDEMLPQEPWNRSPEIIRQITPIEGRDRLITPKNLVARLLAETGLAGTFAFTTFVLAILGCVIYLWLSPSPEQKYWGLSGFLGMVVFGVIIFSFDSFAFPKMWVFFAMLTAAAHLANPGVNPVESP
jgi:hypothetical protein